MKARPLRERFEERFALIEKPIDGCWIWRWSTVGRGYPVIGKGGRGGGNVYVHRLSYEYFVGPIPDGLDICHHCDNPPCVRPEHLFPGTRKANMDDAKQKGRLAKGEPVTHRGKDNGSAKLTDEQVFEIRRMYDQEPRTRNEKGQFIKTRAETLESLALHFGVSDTLIWSVVHRRAWRHL